MAVVNEYFKQRKQDKGGNWRESYIRERETEECRILQWIGNELGIRYKKEQRKSPQ